MRIDLIGAQEKSLSVAVNNQVSINCYPIASPRSRSGLALVGTPGQASFSSTTGTMRGCTNIESADEVPYFVIGTALYSVASNGTATNLGTIPGSGRVCIVRDDNTVIVVNGTDTGYFYDIAGTTFSSTTLTAAADTVTLSDGYAIFSGQGQSFFISNVGDVDSFDALDFAQARKSPDDIVAVMEDHSEIFVFGRTTIEPWYNIGGEGFPFGRNTAGVIERGLYSAFSAAKDDNTIFFLGNDLLVYRLEGYSPVRVSDDSTETILSDLLKDGYESDLRTAFAFFYVDHGHKFYQLTVPNRVTLVYDVATKAWHQRKHDSYETHNAVCYVKAFGKHLVGALDGEIYEMSRDYYSDDGTQITRTRRSHVFSSDDRLLHWKSIKLLFEFGTTPLLSGQGSDPQVILRWSDDSGYTFKNNKYLTLGEQGDYTAKAIKRNCGCSRARVLEIIMTDPAPFVLLDAFATIR